MSSGPKTPSEKLYKEIVTAGTGFIDSAIAEKMVENYYLDFKTTEEQDYAGKRKLLNADQKNYAKAISAFGNSEGGVVIWGVETGSADTDYAVGKKPITKVSNFHSLLEGFTSILTSPPHPSVKNEIIYEDKTKDTGYIATFIPKSSQRPFQVINNSDFRYYIRAGSSSLPAPDTFLRSLFGQEPQPNVFVTWGVGPVKFDEMDGAIHIEAGVILYNGGENVAKNINGYAQVGGRDMAIQLNTNFSNQFDYYKNNISGMKVGFTAKNGFILGVEQEVQPLIVHINIKNPITDYGIQIIALVNCDNQISHKLYIEISREELEKMYDSYVKERSYDIAGAILTSKDEEK